MKKNSFVEGTLIAYIAILLTKILGAVYVIPFYRIIGESGGVLYGYAYNIYNLFLNISTSGIPTAVAIIISEYNALKMFNEREYTFKIANRLISVISTIAFVIMFVFARYIALFWIKDIESGISIQSIELAIRAVSLCLLVVPFLSVTRGYLQGNKFVAVSSFSQLIEQFIRIAVALIGSYVAINIFEIGISNGVGIALLGPVLGALAALVFLTCKIKKNSEEFGKSEEINIRKSSVKAKDIMKKIFFIALPLVIVSITQDIYQIMDLKLILKGLTEIGFDGDKSQIIANIVVTWTPKICMIINSLAIGLCASIIPFVVDAFVQKDFDKVNEKFNQSINTILFVAIPLAFFMIIFRNPIYYIFYGNSDYGGNVLGVMAVVSITFSISLVINMILQGMKKYNIVYSNTIIGIVVNMMLDIPLILFLYNLGFPAYLGSLCATIIGQIVSISIVMISLKIKYHFKYDKIILAILKILLPLACMIGVTFILSYFVNTEVGGYAMILFKLGVCGVISIGTYLLIAYKNNSLKEVLGEEIIDKVLKKLRIRRG